MSRRPQRSSKRRQKSHRLEAGTASLFDNAGHAVDPTAKQTPEVSPFAVPTRVLNTVIAVFLLPIVGIWGVTFFNLFSLETLHHGFWATEEFRFFGFGSILWIFASYALPKKAIRTIYVYGHEWTHTIWSWLMGGDVDEINVEHDGGHIITSKSNVWIALAPYFYPIYSVLVIILYTISCFFWDMTPHICWLFLALGFTWTFHIAFTVWMIPQGQSDLALHGTFFSVVLICLMNLILITGLLLLTAPHVTFHGFAREFLHNASEFSGWVARHLRR